MLGGMKMITVQDNLFSALTDASKTAVNEYIEFLYHKENRDTTLSAMGDVLDGNTVGPFDSVEALMDDLYEDD